MPLWRRVAGPELHPPNTPADWMASGAWRRWEAPLNVVKGESFRQAEIQSIAGPPRDQGWLVPVEAHLVRDRWNPHDRNAIKVEVRGLHVGFIARELAAWLAPILDGYRVKRHKVPGIIRGGRIAEHGMALVVEVTGRGEVVSRAEDRSVAMFYGVHLWLDRRLEAGPLIEVSKDMRGRYVIPWPPPDWEGTEEPER